MDDTEILTMRELQVGDVIVGSYITPLWDNQYTVVSLPDKDDPCPDVFQVIGSDGRMATLWGGLQGDGEYRFNVKSRQYKYDPKQAGDTDDDI